MSRFVLDCSVTMAWGFEDEADAYADRVLAALQRAEAVVPALWMLEVINVLVVAERLGRLDAAGSQAFIHTILQLPIRIDEGMTRERLPLLLGLARAHRLSSYDAAYLDLALIQGLPLATRDTGLESAALAAGVARYDP